MLVRGYVVEIVYGPQAGAFAFVVDFGVGGDGADDGVRRQSHKDVFGLFEDGFEGVADGLVAAPEKAGGAGVAANGGVVGEAVGFGDFDGTAPAEEVEFDGVEVGVAANAALTLMAFSRGLVLDARSLSLGPAATAMGDGPGVWVRFDERLEVFEGCLRHVSFSIRGLYMKPNLR